jgi:hypothetical protein
LSQKLGLKQLISLRQELVSPVPMDMAKGLEGMNQAHEILQKKEASGVLIGGLSEAVWNQRRKPEELSDHNDVDVLVIDDVKIEKFEGAIDWWLPEEGMIKTSSAYSSSSTMFQKWYVNGNGVVLSFGAQKRYSLQPGLYIPDYDWVIEMREAEGRASIDY